MTSHALAADAGAVGGSPRVVPGFVVIVLMAVSIRVLAEMTTLTS